MTEQIRRFYPDAEILQVPVADGGEGSVDAFLTAMGGEKVHITCSGPYLEDLQSYYAILPDGTAVIEMASCAGLPLVDEARRDPSLTTTYGVGQQILDAIKRGATNLIIGLGGSATNDLGCGAAAAMGVVFYDKDNKPFIPIGADLDRISKIDASEAQKRLEGVTITTMCDINNPLYGPNGAAAVFGPQKGADEAMVRKLDANLRQAAQVIHSELGVDVADIPGAGAAGGMGAGMVAFFGSELKMGIQVVLDTVKFDELLVGTDLVFTGEGRVDSQTLSGKVVAGVASRAKAASTPVLVIAGGLPEDDEAIYDLGVTAMFSINRTAEDFSISRFKSKSNLAKTTESIMRLYKAYDL